MPKRLQTYGYRHQDHGRSFIEYAKIANTICTDRAQEGSEHFFAYNAEYCTNRPYVHGALLSMGIYVIGAYYYDCKGEIEPLLTSLGQDHTLESLGSF